MSQAGWVLMVVAGVLSVAYLAYAWLVARRGERVPGSVERSFVASAIALSVPGLALTAPVDLLVFGSEWGRLLIAAIVAMGYWVFLRAGKRRVSPVGDQRHTSTA